ncbi:MAG: site-2 protease family protein [Candidatus Eisenbacteria bacterium]|nr:site-2 protease family protein [Candidatus Eisenbacteria bacterium]
MRWSFTIGRLFGIRVELHVTFLLFVGWFALTQGLFTGEPQRAIATVALLLMVFGCVVLHELGHALTARRYGIRTRDIVLLPIGGVARLERMPEKPTQEIVVAIAGPAVNVAIGALLVALMGALQRPLGLESLRGGLLGALVLVNLVMVLFNLIPAFPMDGGRVLRALLALKLPYVRATRIASMVGQGFALLFGMAGLLTKNPMLMLVALFVFLAAAEERTLVQTRTSLTGLPVRAAMLTEFHRLDITEPLRRAVEYLMAGSQQDFPVMHGDRLAGMLRRTDLILALQSHGIDTPVGEVIQSDFRYAEASDSLEDVVMRMRGSDHAALPVLDEDRLVGLVTADNVGDLLLVRDALRRYAAGG